MKHKRSCFSFTILLFLLVLPRMAADTNIRIVSINAWSGLTYSGTFRVGRYETADEAAFRYGILVRQLENLEPDIVIVNEANPLPAYAKRLARDLDMGFVYAIRAGGVRLGPVGFPVNLREGDVVLIKEPLSIEYLGNRDILGGASGNVGSFTLKETTHLLLTRIVVGGTELYVIVTRWTDTEPATRENLDQLAALYTEGTLTSEEYLSRVHSAVEGNNRRITEAEATIAIVEEFAEESQIILAGSLHAVPGSRPVEILLEAGFTDAFGDATQDFTRDAERNSIRREYFPPVDGGGIERSRVDYLLIRGDRLSVASREIAFDDATFDTHPSDHFGLVVDLEIREQGE